MKKKISILMFAAMSLAPSWALSADPTDSEYHSQVTTKVQQDHAADVKSGKIAKTRNHQTSNSSGQGVNPAQTSTTAATGGTSGTIAHPTQVQDAKKKKATPPPPKPH